MNNKQMMDYNDIDKQKLYLRYIISDYDIFQKVAHIIKPEYFIRHSVLLGKDANKEEVWKLICLDDAMEFIRDYAAGHGEMPDREQIFAETEVELEGFSDEEEELTDAKKEWFLDEFEDFCQFKCMEKAVISASKSLMGGKIEGIGHLIQAASEVCLDDGDDDLDLLEDYETEVFMPEAPGSIISTGVTDLDDMLFGGFRREEMDVFLAGTNGGKSLMLQNLGVNFIEQNLNVFYATLEMSQKSVGRRMSSMITGMGTVAIKLDLAMAKSKFGEKTKDAKESGQKTVIRKFPGSGTTTNDIKAALEKSEKKHGVKFDVLLVDYIGKMDSDQFNKSNNNLGAYDRDNVISDELRNLAFDKNMLVVTAAQTNREAQGKKGGVGLGSVQGGFSKCQNADNVFLIDIVDDASMELTLLKARETNAGRLESKTITVKCDIESMRISEYLKPPMNTPRVTPPAAKQDLPQNNKFFGEFNEEENGQSASSEGISKEAGNTSAGIKANHRERMQEKVARKSEQLREMLKNDCLV